MGKETQAPYKFPKLVSGTTMKSVQFVVTQNGSAPTTNLDDVEAIFYKDGARTLSLTVGSGITIDDASTWTITVGPVDSATTTGLEPGDHSGMLRTTDVDGNVSEYLFLTLPVLPTAPPAP